MASGKPEELEEIWVLFVDDDPMQLVLVKPLIESYDPLIHVETLSDPRKVVEAVQRFDYDCVVSEYIIGVSHGINVFKAVKNVKPVPTVLYTSKDYDEVAKVAQVADINGYMMKLKDPKYYPALIKFIREIVKRYRKYNPKRHYRDDPTTSWQTRKYEVMRTTASEPVS